MLDILSRRGRLSAEQEQRAVGVFRKHHPDYIYAGTPKDKPADIDAVLVNGSDLVAVVETKCRKLTLQQLLEKYQGLWLVSFDKIERARRGAMSHQVPLVGWLWLDDDQLLLTQRLCEADGTFAVTIAIKTTMTQRTINGGTAVRSNAFIPMDKAKVLR
jgi:hypothetical protein